MYGMFWSAHSFNQNIGGWSVENVYEMGQMFNSASSFNQNIGGWSVDNVRDMHRMFDSASAFDQDLGWCVDDDVEIYRSKTGWDGDVFYDAFYYTRCASTSCGVEQVAGGCAPPVVDAARRLATSSALLALALI